MAAAASRSAAFSSKPDLNALNRAEFFKSRPQPQDTSLCRGQQNSTRCFDLYRAIFTI